MFTYLVLLASINIHQLTAQCVIENNDTLGGRIMWIQYQHPKETILNVFDRLKNECFEHKCFVVFCNQVVRIPNQQDSEYMIREYFTHK